MKHQTFFSPKERQSRVPNSLESLSNPPTPPETASSYAGLVTSIVIFAVLAALGAYFGGESPVEPEAEIEAPLAIGAAVCDTACADDACAHPWTEAASCLDGCREHLARCSDEQLAGIDCSGDCDAVNECLASVSCDES